MRVDDFHEELEPKLPPLPVTCPRCTKLITGTNPFCKCGFDLRYGTPKKQKIGKCIYCGFNGKLSAEHIFGDWLRRRFNKPAETRKHLLVRPAKVKFFADPAAVSSIVNVESQKQVQPYSTTVFNVCEICNNTWMGAIHQSAQPIVLKFANGYWPKLSSADVSALARWVVMVTINLESHGRINAVTDYQKSELKAGRMPPGFRISAGRMPNAKSGGNSFFRVFKAPLKFGDDYLTGQISYFCIENVVFSSTSSLGDRISVLLRYSGVPQQLLPRRIWPVCDPASRKTLTRVTNAALDTMMETMESPYDQVK